MTIDTNELRRLTQAATSGEWYVERGNHIYGRNEVTDGEEVWHPVIARTDDDEVSINFEGNANFIAAANPATISELLDRLEAAEKERDDLRARIKAMEQQKPVGCVESLFDDYVIINNNFDRAAPVYLAPGAQPTPSIPEGWKLVPTAESRHPGIYKMLGALHAVDNTPGASEWESYAAFLAAAPEVKP